VRGEYPRFKDIYSREALVAFFHLTESERTLVNNLRGHANRLGAAIRVLQDDTLLGRLTTADLRGLNPLFFGHINPYGLICLDLDQPPILELEAV
jgi:hypothetical protein